MPAPGYILALLFTGVFTLATWLQPHALTFNQSRKQSDNLLALTLGDARRMFANHFFIKADVYFHSGYYPSIFNQARTNQPHISEQAEAGHPEAAEEEADFLGQSHDWIEKFGRNFSVTEHTHLAQGREREMLPWLRLAAELDPQQVEIYTVGSYWLREQLQRPDQAEEFLREGLRANPESFEILFALGRLYVDSRHDPIRARNLLELADRKLLAQEKAASQLDLLNTRQIIMALAKLEAAEGHFSQAIAQLQRLVEVVPLEPTKQELRAQIEELRAKIK